LWEVKVKRLRQKANKREKWESFLEEVKVLWGLYSQHCNSLLLNNLTIQCTWHNSFHLGNQYDVSHHNSLFTVLSLEAVGSKQLIKNLHTYKITKPTVALVSKFIWSSSWYLKKAKCTNVEVFQWYVTHVISWLRARQA
jgi:hypothetical protein